MIQRTARVFGSLLHGDVSRRIAQNERLMAVLTEALSLSMPVRQMIDRQVQAALARDPRVARLEAQVAELSARLAALEGADQSSKASL